MKSIWQPSRADVFGILIILVCSPLFAILQGYQDPALFGSIARALLVSFMLGFIFVFPYSLYLLVKYLRLLFVSPVAN